MRLTKLQKEIMEGLANGKKMTLVVYSSLPGSPKEAKWDNDSGCKNLSATIKSLSRRGLVTFEQNKKCFGNYDVKLAMKQMPSQEKDVQQNEDGGND